MMGSQRGEWRDVILPAIPSGQYTQHMSYLIKDLEPSAQYEARVQAKNRFGWNQLSENFRFSTRSAGQFSSSFINNKSILYRL
ncbi:hypothetical protein O3M35_005374 [Rhynocoris fuscipes]|uniref:Fibronectin type-III domain-containing protein n=1 Tax=Rhynocoris fuscipes TaxID=488301 RepID=A0AAW1DNE8_9HEMI